MELKRYIIERDVPGAAKLSEAELKAIAQKSCSVLDSMGSDIKWIHSYVTGDRIYCFYEAADEEHVRRHAREGGFPANRISEVAAIIDPGTATG